MTPTPVRNDSELSLENAATSGLLVLVMLMLLYAFMDSKGTEIARLEQVIENQKDSRQSPEKANQRLAGEDKMRSAPLNATIKARNSKIDDLIENHRPEEPNGNIESANREFAAMERVKRRINRERLALLFHSGAVAIEDDGDTIEEVTA